MIKKGFTIIELIVTMVILGIVSAMGASVIKFSYDHQKKIEAFNALEVKSQVFIDFLTTHLDNSIKESFRLKTDYNVDCKITASNECRSIFNISEDISARYSIFEWASIDILSKRDEQWSGVLQTSIINKNWSGKAELDGSFVEVCSDCDPSGKEFGIDYTSFEGLDLKSGGLSGDFKIGIIYFLGENNFANTSGYINNENIYFHLDKTRNQVRLYYNMEKRREISASYVLVKEIEGIKYDKDKKAIYFYNKPINEYLKDPSISEDDLEPLVTNVGSFTINNQNGVTKIQICLETDGLPGSYFSPETSIKTCKTGVII